MYLRRTTRRVGDKTYHNYLLVESVATPKGPRQRVRSRALFGAGPCDGATPGDRQRSEQLGNQAAQIGDPIGLCT